MMTVWVITLFQLTMTTKVSVLHRQYNKSLMSVFTGAQSDYKFGDAFLHESRRVFRVLRRHHEPKDYSRDRKNKGQHLFGSDLLLLSPTTLIVDTSS